jgi:hypothetical protein
MAEAKPHHHYTTCAQPIQSTHECSRPRVRHPSVPTVRPSLEGGGRRAATGRRCQAKRQLSSGQHHASRGLRNQRQRPAATAATRLGRPLSSPVANGSCRDAEGRQGTGGRERAKILAWPSVLASRGCDDARAGCAEGNEDSAAARGRPCAPPLLPRAPRPSVPARNRTKAGRPASRSASFCFVLPPFPSRRPVRSLVNQPDGKNVRRGRADGACRCSSERTHCSARWSPAGGGCAARCISMGRRR